MDVMTAVTPRQQTEYPESDGKPMAETDRHRQEMTDAIESLADFFRDDPDVYVAGNLLLYYEEGNRSASIAPDVFVVKGIPKRERRTYRLWEEGRPPDFVIEVTSHSTRLEDQGNKRVLYAMLGVREYFLYDPLAEYLNPPLQGFRLADADYERIKPASDGSLFSQVLGLTLGLEGDRLRFVNPSTGQPLLRPAEAQEQARAEAAARRAAEQRAAEAEAELAQLRAELARFRAGRDQESGNQED